MGRQSKLILESSNQMPSRKAALAFIRFYGKFMSDQQTKFTIWEDGKQVRLDAVCTHSASLTAWRAMDNLQMRLTAWLDCWTVRQPPKRTKKQPTA